MVAMADPLVVSPTSQAFNGARYSRGRRARYFTRSVGRRHREYLHRAVWSAANGPIPAGHDVHHEDHDRANNALANLILKSHGRHTADHQATPERKAAARASFVKHAHPAAKEWHASEAGRAWHRKHGRASWKGRAWRDVVCMECGKRFKTRNTEAVPDTRFCGANCKMRAYRRRRAAEGRPLRRGPAG